MSSLIDFLDGFVTEIRHDIEDNSPRTDFDAAFERYLAILTPALNRYRHHLNSTAVDTSKLKLRFQFETAFLHTLTTCLEQVSKNLHQVSTCWPVYQPEYPFGWYKIPQAIQERIDQIDFHALTNGRRLDDTLAGAIADILGHAGKRYAGEYYTPLPLAKHLVDLSGFQPDLLLAGSRVIDPACGGGIILTEITHRVVEYAFAENLNPQDVFHALTTQLHGFDIQPFAIVLTKTLLLHVCFPLFARNPQMLLGDLFVNIRLFDPLPELRAYEKEGIKFDFIIANPPYLSVKREFLDFAKDYEQILHGHPNLFQLFLWWAVQMANSNGVLSFLIPQSILVGPYFKTLRKELDLQTKIRSLTRMLDRKGIVEDADQQMMALCLSRNNGHTENCPEIDVRVTRNGNDAFTVKPQTIAYSRVVQRIGGIVVWVVSDNFLDYEIVERLESISSPLADLPYEFRCGNGEFVWNEHKNLLRSEADNESVPLVSAVSIEPYRFAFPYSGSHASTRRQYAAVNHRVRAILHSEPSVLVQRTTPRKVGRRLVSCVLPNSFCQQHESYFLENHVIYVKSAEKELLYGLMGWLNSDLINFVFQMRNGTAHTSVSELNALPVNTETLRRISYLGEKITRSTLSEGDITVLDLNNTIFDWLQLGVKHQYRIKEILTRTERNGNH